MGGNVKRGVLADCRSGVACVIAAAIVVGVSVPAAFAGTGWLTSYNYTFFTQDTTYSLNGGGFPSSTTGSPVGAFAGANLGVYDWRTPGDLYLNSAISAWADGGDTYSNFSLWYRVFSGTGSGTGSFTQVSDTSLENIGGNDFRGFATGVNLEQIAKTISDNTGQMGTFTVQTYLSRSHTWSGGGPYTTYLTTAGDTGGVVPTGNYFAATYVATPEPSTYVMAAFAAACCGLQALRRRRVRT